MDINDASNPPSESFRVIDSNVENTMVPPQNASHSPTSSTSSPLSARFSWSSNRSTVMTPIETYDLALPQPTSQDENELELINKARERLAGRQVELENVIQQCNSEMDIVRTKLCKDLRVLEVIKGEIEKAGTGPMRDQLETDFYNGMDLPVWS
jgi:hypothetical protein